MAQLIYLPLLLLATIQLLTVSEEVNQWLENGLLYTMTKNCENTDWITEFSCTAERWNWKLICCEAEENLEKVRFVAVPKNSMALLHQPQNSDDSDTKYYYYYNKDNVINLKEVKGPIKICLCDNTFFLSNESNQMCDECGNECSDVLNTGNGGSQQDIKVHLQPSDDWIVNIRVEISDNVKNYSIKCTSGNTDLQFYSEPKTWIEALKTCRGNRSELVHITNQSVWYDVNSLLKKEKAKDETVLNNGTWIGLERSIFGCKPKWMWTSGEEVNNPHWDSSFPVDSLNHHCGKVMWFETSCNSTWLDEDCFEKLPFICQRKT